MPALWVPTHSSAFPADSRTVQFSGEIARRADLSRNTCKKYLGAGEEMPRYAKRTGSSKLDPYAEKLATWLAIEATKSRKQRRNLRQIHTGERLW
jgi:hypothetical protein